MSVLSVVCGQVEVTASGLSLEQRSSTECREYEYDREASILRRSWPSRVCCAKKNNYKYPYLDNENTGPLFLRVDYEVELM